MRYRPFEDLYRQVLIQEMNQEVIDYIASHRSEPLPWDNLFGDKKRMIIPLEKENRFSPIIDRIKKLPNFYEFDADNERVIFKKPRDPKFGKGEFYYQPKSIGSVINDLPFSHERKRRELALFATYKAEFMKELKDPSRDPEYSIVFSRSPNDVIRMSDWPALDSCLAKGGCNFHRVAHEAIKGGGVAYVVKNKYLKHFYDDPDFLNGDDAFSDDQRDIAAVYEPESRIRIRRFVNDKGMDFAVPENALFGNQRLPTFYQSMVNYLKPRQPSVDEVKKAFQNSDILLKGSSYGMKDLDEMLGEYFGEADDEFVDYKKEDDLNRNEHESIKGLVTGTTDALEEDLREVDRRYPLEHAYSDWNIDDDNYDNNNIGYTFTGGIAIDLEDLQLNEEIDSDMSDEYEIRRRYEQGDDFGDFIQELSEYNFGGGLTMSSYYYNEERNTMYIGLTPDDSYAVDSDVYDTFRYNLKRGDEEYEDTHDEIVQKLLRFDLIEDLENRPGEYERLKGDMKEEEDWVNFRHEATVKHLKLVKYSPEALIVNNKPFKDFKDMTREEYSQFGHFESEFNRFTRTWKSSIEDSLRESMLNLMDHNFRPRSMKPTMTQGELGIVSEQFKTHRTQRLVDFEIGVFLANNRNYIEYSNFSLKTNTAKDVAFELADYWDEMWQHMQGMLTLIA